MYHGRGPSLVARQIIQLMPALVALKPIARIGCGVNEAQLDLAPFIRRSGVVLAQFRHLRGLCDAGRLTYRREVSLGVFAQGVGTDGG